MWCGWPRCCLGFAVPTALIGRGMADWVEVGLACFFLLSGAALCLQWQGRFDARRYFVGRAAATYPAFWLGFGALFLYGEVLHGNNADIPCKILFPFLFPECSQFFPVLLRPRQILL